MSNQWVGVWGRSPEGDQLRAKADKIGALVDRTAAAANHARQHQQGTSTSLRGFPFEGPLAIEMRSTIDRNASWLGVLAEQLDGAASAAAAEAERLRRQALELDRRWWLQQEQRRQAQR